MIAFVTSSPPYGRRASGRSAFGGRRAAFRPVDTFPFVADGVSVAPGGSGRGPPGAEDRARRARGSCHGSRPYPSSVASCSRVPTVVSIPGSCAAMRLRYLVSRSRARQYRLTGVQPAGYTRRQRTRSNPGLRQDHHAALFTSGTSSTPSAIRRHDDHDQRPHAGEVGGRDRFDFIVVDTEHGADRRSGICDAPIRLASSSACGPVRAATNEPSVITQRRAARCRQSANRRSNRADH